MALAQLFQLLMEDTIAALLRLMVDLMDTLLIGYGGFKIFIMFGLGNMLLH